MQRNSIELEDYRVLGELRQHLLLCCHCPFVWRCLVAVGKAAATLAATYHPHSRVGFFYTLEVDSISHSPIGMVRFAIRARSDLHVPPQEFFPRHQLRASHALPWPSCWPSTGAPGKTTRGLGGRSTLAVHRSRSTARRSRGRNRGVRHFGQGRRRQNHNVR